MVPPGQKGQDTTTVVEVTSADLVIGVPTEGVTAVVTVISLDEITVGVEVPTKECTTVFIVPPGQDRHGITTVVGFSN